MTARIARRSSCCEGMRSTSNGNRLGGRDKVCVAAAEPCHEDGGSAPAILFEPADHSPLTLLRVRCTSVGARIGIVERKLMSHQQLHPVGRWGRAAFGSVRTCTSPAQAVCPLCATPISLLVAHLESCDAVCRQRLRRTHSQARSQTQRRSRSMSETHLGSDKGALQPQVGALNAAMMAITCKMPNCLKSVCVGWAWAQEHTHGHCDRS